MNILKNINPIYTAVVGICLFTAWHIMVLYTSGINLFFDEAQYWNWSKNPAFGYFSKPPFVAWAIALTTGILSDIEPAVRIASPLAHMMTAFAILLLGKKLFSPKVAMWASLLYITLPGVSFSSLIISTDPFLLMFWAWGLFFLSYALDTNKLVYWLMLGVCFGFGMLSKYAMLFFPISLFIFFIANNNFKTALKNRNVWAFLILGLLIYSPNIYWNYANSFVSYAHTKDNANLSGSLFHPLQALEFVGSQFGVFGPILFAVLLVMLFKIKTFKDERFKFLLSFTLPVLSVMLIEAFLSRANANWAATAYPAAVVAVTAWLAEKKQMKWLRISFVLHVVLAFLLYTEAYTVFDNSKLDIMRRAKGWDYAGAQVSMIIEQNPDSVLLADERKILTPMLYYVTPRPEVIYKWNPRKNIKDHYDLTANANTATAKNFVLVSRQNNPDAFKTYFAKVDLLKKIEINIYDDYQINLFIFKLQGFKGY